MKITVIGAGAIGSTVAQDLLRNDDVRLVQICDARARSLQELQDEVQSDRLRSFQVDARDPNVLAPILDGSDCVVGCVPSGVNPKLAQQCLDLGIHYCDLGGSEDTVRRTMKLHDEARSKSVWLMPNCGLAPGLSNVLCLRGIDQFDEVDAAELRVGDVPLYPEPPFNFRISWSAEKVIEDYTQPVYLIEDGDIHEAAPLSHEEVIHFDAPFGQMEAFCTAGGLSTLTDDLRGKVRTLDHKTIRWPGHAHQMRFLLGLGFGEERNIDVRTHLTYRDVLRRRMQQRLGGAYEDAVLLRVCIRGQVDGEKRTLVYEMIERYDADTGTTAMRRCTSIPTAVAALMLASHNVSGGGVAPPENVLPREAYCNNVADYGLDVTARWHDGYVGVQQPSASAEEDLQADDPVAANRA